MTYNRFAKHALWWVTGAGYRYGGDQPLGWEGDLRPVENIDDVLHRLAQNPWYADHGAAWQMDWEGHFYRRLETAMDWAKIRYPQLYEQQLAHMRLFSKNGVAIPRPRTEKVREMASEIASSDRLPHGAREEWPYAVQMLPLNRLLVDDTYQRPPHRKFISDIVDAFDPTLVGSIDVSARRNGYAVLDGQQRFLAMQQVHMLACWCNVYTGMSVPEEAAFFYKKNRDRMSMGAYYGFRARVVAGDQNALAIHQAVEACGFTLGDSSNQREVIGAVSAVEQVWNFQSEYWEELLTPTLTTIHQAVFGRKDSLHSSMLQGVGRFWQTYKDEEVDREILHAVILEIGGPTALIGMAKEKRVVTSTVNKGMSTSWMMARVLSEWYNRALRGGKRGRHFEGRLPIERLGV